MVQRIQVRTKKLDVGDMIMAILDYLLLDYVVYVEESQILLNHTRLTSRFKRNENIKCRVCDVRPSSIYDSLKMPSQVPDGPDIF